MKDFLVYFSCVIIASILMYFGICIIFPATTNNQYKECESAIKQYYKEGKTEKTQVTPKITVAKGLNKIYAIYGDKTSSRLSADIVDGELKFKKHSIVNDHPYIVSGIFIVVFLIIYFFGGLVIDCLIDNISFSINSSMLEKNPEKYNMKHENRSLESGLREILIKLILLTSLLIVALKLFEINGILAAAFMVIILGFSGCLFGRYSSDEYIELKERKKGIGNKINDWFEKILLLVVLICILIAVILLVVDLVGIIIAFITYAKTHPLGAVLWVGIVGFVIFCIANIEDIIFIGFINDFLRNIFK